MRRRQDGAAAQYLSVHWAPHALQSLRLIVRPSAVRSATSADHTRWSGVRYRWHVYVELAAKTLRGRSSSFSTPVLTAFSKHSFSQGLMVYPAHRGCGDDALYKFTFYIITLGLRSNDRTASSVKLQLIIS